MKPYLLFFAVAVLAMLRQTGLAQNLNKIKCEYDAAGNRIARYYVPGIKKQNNDTLPFALAADSLLLTKIDEDPILKVGAPSITPENSFLANTNLATEKGISLYPNPTMGEVYLSLTNLKEGETAQIELRDVNGRLLSSKTTGQGTVNWDLSAYAQGSYIFTVVLAGKRGVFTVVKQ